jgi:hypothetical protein
MMKKLFMLAGIAAAIFGARKMFSSKGEEQANTYEPSTNTYAQEA